MREYEWERQMVVACERRSQRHDAVVFKAPDSDMRALVVRGVAFVENIVFAGMLEQKRVGLDRIRCRRDLDRLGRVEILDAAGGRFILDARMNL
jgi:hypothetical protein